MSSPQVAPKVATAEHPSIIGGDNHVAYNVAHNHPHVPAAKVLHPKHREALKLRLDLNLEVEIHIQAKRVNIESRRYEQNLDRVLSRWVPIEVLPHTIKANLTPIIAVLLDTGLDWNPCGPAFLPSHYFYAQEFLHRFSVGNAIAPQDMVVVVVVVVVPAPGPNKERPGPQP
ncbi:hypothetical protein IW261DRAFT_1417945 [Armillaria novae-zelandiae]|uniref:Uncharacterized protein n=1 Tax=Armillaria novae-zelandiae TaxID=153914 RepID=A0AA39TDV7_9AGAR|nr:hypothetical protein IW261DRAFT_1417945 [Armillaria novae-zelandiae]